MTRARRILPRAVDLQPQPGCNARLFSNYSALNSLDREGAAGQNGRSKNDAYLGIGLNMQTAGPSLQIETPRADEVVARASYSGCSLVRRALLGLVLIAVFTSASAWLLHATTQP